ncbi:multidrug efflux SMR transporter [Streptomyces sp. NP160]|nr:multidrug efflux SMR transporter [Streptomyces sp. NP160]
MGATLGDGPRRRPRSALLCHPVGGPRPGPRTRAPYPDSDKTAVLLLPRPWRPVVSWLVLVLSGVLEAVWATALGRSEGFTRPGPTVVFAVAILASMAGLAYAMRELPVGTSYAVWVGIGATLTVAYAMVTGTEPVSVPKVVFLTMIVGGVVGLKLVH